MFEQMLLKHHLEVGTGSKVVGTGPKKKSPKKSQNGLRKKEMQINGLAPSRFFLLPDAHPSGPGLRDFLIFFRR